MRISDWSSDVCSSDLAVRLHLAVELARPPAGVAERQQVVARPLADGDRPQDVDGGGQRHAVVHPQRAVAHEVGAVQHEPPAALDRPAEMDPKLAEILAAGYPELLQQVGKGDRRDRKSTRLNSST